MSETIVISLSERVAIFYFCRILLPEILFIMFQTLLMDVRLFLNETKFCHDGHLAVFFVLSSGLAPDDFVMLDIFRGWGGFNFPSRFLPFVNGFFACIIKPDCVVLTNGEFAFGDIIFGYSY